MQIYVRLTKSLCHLNNGRKEAVQTLPDGSNIAHLIDEMEKEMPGIRSAVFDTADEIADSINLYVKGENIRYLQGSATILSDGDQVNIIPAAAAG